MQLYKTSVRQPIVGVQRGSRSRRALFEDAARAIAGTALGTMLVERGSIAALAQAATPSAGMDLSTFPELRITVTDQELQLSTETVPAGYVLVTVTNQQSPQAGSTGAGLIGPPTGMSMDDFLQQVQTQLTASPVAGATPTSIGGFPLLAFTAVIRGGPGNIDPGQTGQAIIQVPSGEWAAIAEGNQPAVRIMATAGTPAAGAAPNATVTVNEVEFSFGGLEGAIPAGQQLWAVVNHGAEPHMLVLQKGPADLTMAMLESAMSAPEGATPAPGSVSESDFQDAGGVFLQSAGTTVWPVLNLEPGRYAALCFVPDPRNGMPHAAEGMISVFDVGGGPATPAS